MPMNMMQSILDKTGMGGFRTGISDRDQLFHSNQDLADKDLINRRNTNLYENELLDNPLKAAERAMKLAKAESDTTDITSGGYDAARKTEREKAAAELAAKLDENQRKKIEDAANAAVRAASIFKDDDPPLLKEQKWGTAAQILREAGQTNVPDRYDPTAYEALMQRAKAAPMTLHQIQTIQAENLKHKNAGELETQKSGHALELADINNAASLERTNVQAKATRDAAAIHAAATQRLIKDQDDRVQLAVENAIKTGTPVDVGTIQGLASLAEQYASQQVTKNKSRIEAAASKAARDGKPVEEARAGEEAKVAAEARAAYMKRAEGVKIANSAGEVIGQVKDGKVVGVKQDGKTVPTGQSTPAPAAPPKVVTYEGKPVAKTGNLPDGGKLIIFEDGTRKVIPASAKAPTELSRHD